MFQLKGDPRIVVVDDDADMLDLIGDFLKAKGKNTLCFSDPLKALEFFKTSQDSPDLMSLDCLVSDIQMPSLSGHELLAQLKMMGIEIPIIFATAFGSVDSAIESMRQGAFDYIVKPFRLGDLEVKIEKAAKLREARRENLELRKTIAEGGEYAGLIGRSPAMKVLFAKIDRVAPTHAAVSITGESGTGKELVARAIHMRSGLAPHSFLSINCAAMPGELLEQELFGQPSVGSSHPAQTGLLSAVGKGTLFLDEVGEMSLGLQSKVLHVFEEGRALPNSSGQSGDRFEARLIVSSHKDLVRGVAEGWFRRDLYDCINTVPLKLPPLRERREDIGPLADHFLRKACLLNHFEMKRLDSSAKQLLARQSWPGNVRQLQNLMERLAILLPEERITADDLNQLTSPGVDQQTNEGWFSKLMSLAELEKEYIQFVLVQTQGRKEEAARILGINRRTLYRKERDYDLVPEK